MTFSYFTMGRPQLGRAIAAVSMGVATCWVYGQTAAPTAASPAATSPATAAQTTAGPTITVQAEEVSLNLVVHDKSGKPILDMTPDQIAVTDDGVPVKITKLRLIQGDAAIGRRVTFLFGNLDDAGDKNGRDASAKILKIVPPGTSLAVMNVGSRLRLLQRFTTDREAVARGIAAATVPEKLGVEGNNVLPEKDLISIAQTGADSKGGSVPAEDRSMAKVMLASLQESQRIVQEQYTQANLASLLALARTQREISGQKIVIYFTEGFQMDANATDMVHTIVGAANRSGVTIYVVDLSALDDSTTNEMLATVGLGAAGPGYRAAASSTGAKTQAAGEADNAPFTSHDPGGELRQNAETAGRIESDSLAGTSSPLGSLTGGTGGGYIVAGDSMKKPLKRLLEDMTTYYEASFVPSITEYDGRFRPVQVTPLRKGVFLRYREGYYAIAPGAGSGVRPFEAPLLKALSDATLPTDVNFRAGVLRMGSLADGNTNTLVVETPLDGLEVREDSNTKLYSLHVSVVAQIKDQTGTVIEHFSEDVPRHGAIESLQGPNSDVITLQRHFVAPPGQYVLEAAVLDHNSDKIGAKRVNFEISGASDSLSVSDLALVRRTEPFHAEGDSTEPLRYEAGKIVPNISGQVPKEIKDISVFFIIHPDQHNADPVKLEMEVRKDGKSIGRFPLALRPGVGAGVAVPYLSTIQARSLSPGRYEVAALLSQGAKTAAQSASFTIAGDDLARADVPPGSSVPGQSSGKDDEPVSDSSQPGMGAREASHLAITTPSTAVPPPTQEETDAVLASARLRALGYGDSLPNFSCVEITNRSTDQGGKGDWKHKDSMAQLLRYRDSIETRVILAVNGHKTSVEPEDTKSMTSHGEFGGVLNAVFDPSSHADFQWKETDSIGNNAVQVFTYKVAKAHSNYGLTAGLNNHVVVAFHGLVYIDAATRAVRRITLEAQDLPRDFPIHASAIAVDYDYVVINQHDYLMPMHGTVSISQGRHDAELNELEFRDYRRFGSRIRIIGANVTPPPAPAH